MAVHRMTMTALAVFLGALAAAVPQAQAHWVYDGIPLFATEADQSMWAAVSDGQGGAIVVWGEDRSGYTNLYAQRLSASGEPQWAVGGIAVCPHSADQSQAAVISDGASGVIVVWQDGRSSVSSNLYAQRLSAGGVRQWSANGVPLCTAAGDEDEQVVASDGAGGAIIAWTDYRSPISNIYARRIDAAGVLQWDADGLAICTATGIQMSPAIVPDGLGGAIITWTDDRVGGGDIYAQRVTGAGSVAWAVNGNAICTATSLQLDPSITTDGINGAIIAWNDYRSGFGDIYARRVSLSGNVYWTANGVALCTATGEQQGCRIVSDGANGAIVTWMDHYNQAYDIRAQRVNLVGAIQWTAGGVAVCTAANRQHNHELVADGAGGALVAWDDDRRGDTDIYLQRLSAAGTAEWTPDGVALCSVAQAQDHPMIAPDGTGGAIVAWSDERGEWRNAYAQQIDDNGKIGYLYPDILSVLDVPADQGGAVRLTISRSPQDDAVSYPASLYNVWQRVGDPALSGAAAGDAPQSDSGKGGGAALPVVQAAALATWPLQTVGDRVRLQSLDLAAASSFPAGTWELVGSFAACQQAQYIYQAGTLADSTAGGTPYSVYTVSVHTTDPLLWFASYPDSGYSVDNIAPEVPDGFHFATPAVLAWEAADDADFHYFALYGSTSVAFGPDAALIDHTIGVEMDVAGESYGFYHLTATDYAGNESEAATVAGVTDVPPAVPTRFALSPPVPNPFNPRTQISFDLPQAVAVEIRIHDLAGRLVDVLVGGEVLPAGSHTVAWLGRDSRGRALPSGAYFCRLVAGSFTETTRMTLVR